MSNDAHTTCVSLVPIFQGLSREEQLGVARTARPIRRHPGEVVLGPEDRHARLLVVHRGRVRISHLEAGGAERLVRIMGTGDFIGESAFLMGENADHWATALTEVELCSFAHDDLRQLVAEFPDIAVRMLRTQTQRLVSAERRLADLTLAPVAARLARHLLDLAPDGVGAVVRLPHAKKDVAALLGMSPETLSRQLHDWVREHVIEVAGRNITLSDRGRLEGVAGVREPSRREP